MIYQYVYDPEDKRLFPDWKSWCDITLAKATCRLAQRCS